MVGFHDLVGTDIAPVSKKTAVKLIIPFATIKRPCPKGVFLEKIPSNFAEAQLKEDKTILEM